MNEQPKEIVPPETGHVTLPTGNPDGVLAKVTLVSEGLNPLPDTTTETPCAPEVGLSEITGARLVTCIDAEAESVGPGSCTVTPYKPGATLAMTNDAVKVLLPKLRVHGCGEFITTLGVTNEHVPAAVENPVPVTVMVVPGGPEVGLKEIVGGRTSNGTEAESPPGLALAVTV